jgi:hypothetical protein
MLFFNVPCRDAGLVSSVDNYRGITPVAVRSWQDLGTQGMAGLQFGEGTDLSLSYLGFAIKP